MTTLAELKKLIERVSHDEPHAGIIAIPIADLTALLAAVEALRDLTQEVDSLEDITLTHHIDRYKAQAIWNDVCKQADKALAALGE